MKFTSTFSRILLALAIWTASASMTGLIAIQLRDYERGRVEIAVDGVMEQATGSMIAWFQRHLGEVHRLAREWENSRGSKELIWRRAAYKTGILREYVTGAVWVDPTYNVRWGEPLTRARRLQGATVALSESIRSDISFGVLHRQPIVTKVFTMATGNEGFAIYEPVFVDHEFAGLVGMMINVEKFLRGSISAKTLNQFELVVRQDGEKIAQIGTNDSQWRSHLANVNFRDKRWNVSLTPNALYLQANSYNLAQIAIVVGLIISCCVAGLVYAVHMVRAQARHLDHVAQHDSLTGLPNRRRLDAEIKQRVAAGETMAVIQIDLDLFKQINDLFGRPAGDAVLCETGRRIRTELNAKDLIARVGGDEFILLLSEPASSAQIVELAERLIERLQAPLAFKDAQLRVGASVGIAIQEADDPTGDRMLLNAGLALDRAKKLGKNRTELFTRALGAEAMSATQAADDLIRGIDADEIIAFYQPQVDARTFEIVGVEALARWRHPTRGILAPIEFLPVAEELGMLGEIDARVLGCADRDLIQMRENDVDVKRLSVNVSAKRLRDPALVTDVRKRLNRDWRISIELLESIMLEDCGDDVLDVINSLKALGVDLEVDDFGAGHASIVGLLKVGPTGLKIDRRLIMPITSQQSHADLTRSIIQIGKGMNMSVVAEGVETLEHAMVLKRLGADLLQGYAFAKPMGVEEFMSFAVEYEARRVGMYALQPSA